MLTRCSASCRNSLSKLPCSVILRNLTPRPQKASHYFESFHVCILSPESDIDQAFSKCLLNGKGVNKGIDGYEQRDLGKFILTHQLSQSRKSGLLDYDVWAMGSENHHPVSVPLPHNAMESCLCEASTPPPLCHMTGGFLWSACFGKLLAPGLEEHN